MELFQIWPKKIFGFLKIIDAPVDKHVSQVVVYVDLPAKCFYRKWIRFFIDFPSILHVTKLLNYGSCSLLTGINYLPEDIGRSAPDFEECCRSVIKDKLKNFL